MENMTVQSTYTFETRQRSLVPVATTLQGRAPSTFGFIPVGGTSVLVTEPIGGTPKSAHTPVIALGATDPRLRRTSPL
ncbi:hypothetical protein EDF34_1019 [Cellulomonas sp. PhB150]|nr:hypothetical protein EDF34_1019 [Cellulomonas sp. PhB150]